MTGQPSGLYRVEELRKGGDGTPRWGVRRPDGEWVTSMGKPEWCISLAAAERIAAERNEAKGLTAPR